MAVCSLRNTIFGEEASREHYRAKEGSGSREGSERCRVGDRDIQGWWTGVDDDSHLGNAGGSVDSSQPQRRHWEGSSYSRHGTEDKASATHPELKSF
jgi:hypothetical protein